MIFVVGMGRKKGDLTLDGADVIKNADIVVVKSRLTHAWQTVCEMRSDALSCDEFYENSQDFDEMNAKIAQYLRSFGKKKVAFCVVGQGSDDTVAQLLDEAAMVDGVPMYLSVLSNKMPSGCVVFTAADIVAATRILPQPTIVTAIDDKYVASDVQLKLLTAFDADTLVHITSGDKLKTITLDRLCKQRFDYQTTIFVQPRYLVERKVFDYYDCADILAVLRSENGCPWDREQTHKSIVKNVIEEAYELANALENDDIPNVVEELGDLLMQVLFHLEIGKEDGEYEPQDVYTALCRKLIDRHPHVFGGVAASNADESLSVWEKQKQKEHKIGGVAENVNDVPRVMASLMRSQKVQSRAAKGGYDFADLQQAVDKVKEELAEFLAADEESKQMEGGDLLFAVVNVLRLRKTDSETALMASTDKFARRVVECERILAEKGLTLKELSMQQFDLLWAEAKKNVG